LLQMTTTTFRQRFREAFAAMQARKPMTAAQFGRNVGMSRANVSHWMNGRGRVPTGRLANAAAAELGVNLTWLLEGTGPRDKAPEATERRALEPAAEIQGMELTRDAILVARAFMELPGNLRAEFKRRIETAALEYSTAKPDGELGHLSVKRKKERGTQ
jgi:transcriptional regulator with XRE-family HTH domain